MHIVLAATILLASAHATVGVAVEDAACSPGSAVTGALDCVTCLVSGDSCFSGGLPVPLPIPVNRERAP